MRLPEHRSHRRCSCTSTGRALRTAAHTVRALQRLPLQSPISQARAMETVAAAWLGCRSLVPWWPTTQAAAIAILLPRQSTQVAWRQLLQLRGHKKEEGTTRLRSCRRGPRSRLSIPLHHHPLLRGLQESEVTLQALLLPESSRRCHRWDCCHQLLLEPLVQLEWPTVIRNRDRVCVHMCGTSYYSWLPTAESRPQAGYNDLFGNSIGQAGQRAAICMLPMQHMHRSLHRSDRALQLTINDDDQHMQRNPYNTHRCDNVYVRNTNE